jgi:predicted Zn-dependent peptidase
MQKSFNQDNFDEEAKPFPIASVTNLGKLHIVKDKIEQVYVYIMAPKVFPDPENLYVVPILSTLLGGGTSGRLFQRIRERENLAYHVGCGIDNFVDWTVIFAEADVHKKSVKQTITSILDEIEAVKRGELTQIELDRAKKAFSARLALSTESSKGSLSRLVSNYLLLGDYKPITLTMDGFNRVTLDDLVRLSNQIFQRENIMLFAAGDVPSNLSINGYKTAKYNY